MLVGLGRECLLTSLVFFWTFTAYLHKPQYHMIVTQCTPHVVDQKKILSMAL